jgi:hypothetical protein
LSDFDLTNIKRRLEQHLPAEIERRWKDLVRADLEQNTLLEDELENLEAPLGLSVRASLEANPLLAYGTTLLAVIVHDRFWACLQLGDGCARKT